ncbi:MAG: hydroxymethylbilane synthase, partial [Geovibrio sp.]|nr:hydroxymethylbilane synthase [Geovibrio sp.]
LRRKVQLARLRPDLEIKDLRGNVNTRLRKLDDGEYDAIILARAGLVRLEYHDRVTDVISVEDMLPAVCQGILGIEVRSDDTESKKLLDFLRHEPTETRVRCERTFLRRLEGGCQAPIAGHSVIEGDRIIMKGLVSDLIGETYIEAENKGSVNDAAEIGYELAESILAAGGKEILDEIYSK